MRITIGILFALAAWAQTPAAPPARDPAQIARIRADLDSLSRLVNDYGNKLRYADDNQKIQSPAPGDQRVVFMGDSITDFWGRNNNGSTFFPGKPYINRGISGQVTAQMLLRFHQDVVALKPVAVVILAGTNDIGSNIGYLGLESIEDNIASMADVARANNIKVILASVMPVCDYIQPQTARRSPERIVALNQWIKDYVARSHFVYLDYYSAMTDDKLMFRRELTNDGLHPNAAGYEIMAPLAAKAIATATGK